jgi:hypothetical protein
MTRLPGPLEFRKAVRLAALVAWTMTALGAQALSCAVQRYDETEAKRMFGPAKVVFIGTLREIAGERRTDGWHQRVDAVFTVERLFKGEPEIDRRVGINAGAVVGQRYLVYANEQEGELRADAACLPRALPMGDRIHAHLDFLNGLAAPGSGGDLVLNAIREPFSMQLGGVSLEFEGQRGIVQLKTDAHGAAKAAALAAGPYRLRTVAPPGYRYECGLKPCDDIEVHDRGFTNVTVVLTPEATLGIGIRDSQGRRYDLRAEFNVYSASTGVLLGQFSPGSAYWRINDKPFAAFERIVPGEYVFTLVITETRFDGLFHVKNRQVEVFDSGAANAQSARRVTVKPGENSYVFTLPDTLKPVRTQLVVEGDTQDLSSLSVSLLTGSSASKHTEQASHYFYKSKGHPDHGAFWSLPGQSWQVSTYMFKMENAQHGAVTVAPTQDAVMKVRLNKRP